MRAFEVYLNGKKLCLAGIGDDGVLISNVDWVTRKGRKDLSLSTGGLISSSQGHVLWITQKLLRVGDTIQVHIVESSSVDEPIERYRTDPAEDVRAKKRYVRMMARQLGWKIQARPKRSPS